MGVQAGGRLHVFRFLKESSNRLPAVPLRAHFP
jgi:hypothetical protein